MEQKYWLDILWSTEKDRMTVKQMQIITAAIELFGEKGYAGTSTKEIAQRAKVAEGTIFKHFATKKDLLFYVTTMILNNMLFPLVSFGLEDLMKKSYSSLEEFFEALLSNRQELVENNYILLKVLLQESLFQPEIRATVLERISELPLQKGLEEMQRQGLIIDRPGKEVFLLVITSLFSYIFTRYIFLPEMFTQNPDADRQNYVSFLARAFKPDNQSSCEED